MIFKLKRNKIIDIKKDLEADIKTMNLKLKMFLNNMKYQTSIESNIIKFKRIYLSTITISEYKREGITILKQGEIEFSPHNNNKIRISYFAKLDHIIFMSLSFGLILGFVHWYFSDIELFISITIGMILASIVFLFGYFIIWFKMNELIRLCY